MKYVVTGGAGFVGSHLAETLVENGHEVVILDNLSSGRIENISAIIKNKKVSISRESITNPVALKNLFKGVDGVFHQAAFVSVPRSISDPLFNHEINSTGTLHVLIAARDAGVRKLVFASSAAVYGNLPDLPKQEDMPVDPQSPYAVSKLMGEHYCQIFSNLYGLETVALRYFNVYGPRQDPLSDYAAVIPKFIYQLENGEPPIIYGDGEQTRDFIFVKDVVMANIKAMQSDARGVFNIASGRQTSVIELAAVLGMLFASGKNPVHAPERRGEVKYSVADISRARKRFGFTPEYSLEKGLMTFIKG